MPTAWPENPVATPLIEPERRQRESPGRQVHDPAPEPRVRRAFEPGAHVLRSIALLDDEAIAAVEQFRFRPARDRDGSPVRVIVEVPLRFVLR